MFKKIYEIYTFYCLFMTFNNKRTIKRVNFIDFLITII